MTLKRIGGLVIGLVALGATLAGTAHALSPPCALYPLLACKAGAQDITGLFNFTGSNTVATFDGATADANRITMALSADPAGSFTFTIPANAASAAAVATGLPCSAGNHISNFNATTGAFTCSADSGSARWDQIADPTANKSFAMANFTTLMTWGTATSTADMFALTDGTSNTGTGAVLAVRTGTSSAAKVVEFTAAGSTNGVRLTSGAQFQAFGSGGIRATDLSLTGQATGDIVYFNGTNWVRLGQTAGVLHGGATPSYSTIASGDIASNAVIAGKIAAGALANSLVWTETCTASGATCTLANTPRLGTTLLAVSYGLVMKRVASAPGLNEYTLADASTTFTFGDATNNSPALLYYER